VWRTLEPYSRTFITLAAPGVDPQMVAEEHQPILDALRRRDPIQAALTYRQHFSTTAAWLGSAWDAAPPPVDPDEAVRPGDVRTVRPVRESRPAKALVESPR
jgi:hypothetical protein